MSSNPYRPPESRDAAKVRKPARSLGGLTLGITIVFSLLAIALVATATGSTALVGRNGGGGVSSDSMVDPLVVMLGLSALAEIFLSVAGIVLFCLWVYRASVNADALVSSAMELTPGWAVGWFFVPIANLFKPYQALSEIYRASNPEADPDFWRVSPVPLYLPLWWASWIAYNLIARVNRPLFPNPNPTAPSVPVPGALLLEGAVGALGAVLVVVVTREIHRLQTEKARRVRVVAESPLTPRANPFL